MQWAPMGDLFALSQSRHLQCRTACPLYPRKQTLNGVIAMSAKGPQATFCSEPRTDERSYEMAACKDRVTDKRPTDGDWMPAEGASSED